MTQLQRSSIWYEKDIQKSNIWIFFQCCVLEGVINLLSRLRKKIHHPYNTLYWRSYKNTMFRYHAVKHRNCFNDYHHKKSHMYTFGGRFIFWYISAHIYICIMFPAICYVVFLDQLVWKIIWAFHFAPIIVRVQHELWLADSYKYFLVRNHSCIVWMIQDKLLVYLYFSWV